MMKPIITWYEELPEPFRNQAIKNRQHQLDMGVELPAESLSLASALDLGFIWSKSREGPMYWNRVLNSLDVFEVMRTHEIKIQEKMLRPLLYPH